MDEVRREQERIQAERLAEAKKEEDARIAGNRAATEAARQAREPNARPPVSWCMMTT